MAELNGMRALVTGGSRGIGAAIARALAASGADVAITYVTSKDRAESVVRDIAAFGRRGYALCADQADGAAVASAVDSAVKYLGGLDILVNSAGVFHAGIVGDPGPDGIDAETSARMLTINYGGIVSSTRAAVPHLPSGGRIINIGADTGTASVMYAGFAEYTATKAAIATFSKGAARDLGPRGITVNVVQPGPINTDMNPDEGEWAERLRAAAPLGRFGQPEEVADLVVFLAGPKAAYITGAAITIDGGSTA